MLAARRARPSEAARISATPHAERHEERVLVRDAAQPGLDRLRGQTMFMPRNGSALAAALWASAAQLCAERLRGRALELRARALGRDLDDVPGQPHARHREDQPAGGVELIPAQPVEGRLREGVVVVVPRLAERRQRQPEHVRRLVVGVEAAAAEEVADRVDAPGDVVHEEDPHEAGPQQRAEAAGDERASAQREAEQERQHEAAERDQREAPVDAPHRRVLDEVAREPFRGRLAVGLEQPADVRVPQAR